MSVSTAYIPVANVVTDAAMELRMEDFGGVGKPFFISAAQRALQDLCYDASWDIRQWDTVTPPNLVVDLPPNIIGLRNVYLYFGDSCNIQTSQFVHIKPNMIRKGGQGFLARNTNGSGDLYNWPWQPPNNWLFFAGYCEGKLYLSDSCLQYPRIHVEYQGLGVEQWGEDDFRIPQWAREAVTDYVILKVALRLEQDDLNYYRGVIARKQQEISTGNPNGTWCRALNRWNRMDEQERYDLITQTTRLGHSAYANGAYGIGYGTSTWG